MAATRRFTKSVVAALGTSKILGVRSGTAHRFTGVWLALVGERVFVRSWDGRASGWYHAFREEPLGTMQVRDREVRVRAKPVRSERLLDAVDAAYADRYTTVASRKWVRGFKRPTRRARTLELVPR
jgi:hypothetical protein